MEGVQDQAVLIMKRNTKVSTLISDPGDLKEIYRKAPREVLTEFSRKYGNLLGLLDIKVEGEALSALVQYWNSNLRCFELPQFDAVPTVEEYAQMLGCPIRDRVGVYRYRGHYMEVQKIAASLGIPDNCLVIDSSGLASGLKRVKMEEHLKFLAQKGRWDCFQKTLLLIIFGAVLFPYLKDVLGREAIDAYHQYLENGRCPVPAILAETLLSADICRKNKKSKLRCCYQLLYVWFMTHCYAQRHMGYSPNALKDFHFIPIKSMGAQEWKNEFAGLDLKAFIWTCPWFVPGDVILRCGPFPNVPLMGVRGCISYTPIIALRQLKRVQIMPSEEQLGGLNFQYADEDAELQITRVIDAWGHVHKMESQAQGTARPTASEEYDKWRIARVVQVYTPKKIPHAKEAHQKKEQDLRDKTLQVETLKAEIRQLNTLNDERMVGMMRMEHELGKKDKVLKDQEEEMKQIQDDYRQVNASLKRARMSSASPKVRSLKGQVAELEEMIKEAMAEKESLKTKIKAQQAEIRRIKTEAEEESEELNDQMERLKLFLRMKEARCGEFTTEIRVQKELGESLQKDLFEARRYANQGWDLSREYHDSLLEAHQKEARLLEQVKGLTLEKDRWKHKIHLLQEENMKLLRGWRQMYGILNFDRELYMNRYRKLSQSVQCYSRQWARLLDEAAADVHAARLRVPPKLKSFLRFSRDLASTIRGMRRRELEDSAFH